MKANWKKHQMGLVFHQESCHLHHVASWCCPCNLCLIYKIDIQVLQANEQEKRARLRIMHNTRNNTQISTSDDDRAYR
jgi:hypothetical protein